MALTLNGDGTISSNLADLENVADAAASSDDVLVYDGTAWTGVNSTTQTKADLNATGDAPVYACRAWVNFDGTRDTNGVTSTANTNRLIRASGNVASVLRNLAGDYTITFTTPMPDANYVFSGNCAREAFNPLFMVAGYPANDTGYSASSLRIYTTASNGFTTGSGSIGNTTNDLPVVNIMVFR